MSGISLKSECFYLGGVVAGSSGLRRLDLRPKVSRAHHPYRIVVHELVHSEGFLSGRLGGLLAGSSTVATS